MASPQSHVPFTEPTRERLTWPQICARHPDEWVTLIELEWENDNEDDGELVSAVCIGNGKRRGDSLRATKALRERERVTQVWERFTGRLIPQDHISFRFHGL